MKVFFGQIYIKPGIEFPFSHHFQRRLSEEITALVVPSANFIGMYGRDFDLIIRISAKSEIQDNEIKGPTVSKKDKDVEYTVFLPFDVVFRDPKLPHSALRFLLKGICSVFESLGIATARIVERQDSIIESICSDPMMFE